MMYSFAKLDAVRSFRAAWQRDANCAICYWGEAWAWGSYLNGPILAEHSPFAYAAAKKALALKMHAKLPWEQAFIDAIQVRYVPTFDAKKRMDQERAYADAMKKVADALPEDLDAVTLYADALFLLEPRRGTRDINDPNVQRLHKVLEGVLAKDIKHPGACHLYVHATESTVDPGKAAACAEFLGNAVPGASHMNHMPSHTWNEIGRWNDGVRANIQAWHSDLKAGIGEGFAIYPDHNLHMLLFAASNDGQGAIATQAGKDYAKSTGDTMYQVLTLLRFGRFDEIPAVDKRPEREVPAGLWDFAQGYAKLRAGELDFARLYLVARAEGGVDLEAELPRARGGQVARHRRQHPRGRDRALSRRQDDGPGEVRGGGQARRLARVRRAGAATLRRAALAGRDAARSRDGSGSRGHLPEGAGRASAQRLVAAGPAAGARGAGQAYDRR